MTIPDFFSEHDRISRFIEVLISLPGDSELVVYQ